MLMCSHNLIGQMEAKNLFSNLPLVDLIIICDLDADQRLPRDINRGVYNSEAGNVTFYSKTYLNLTSLGHTFVFGIDRHLVYAG